MYDSFDNTYQATIGIDFLSKTMYLEDRTVCFAPCFILFYYRPKKRKFLKFLRNWAQVCDGFYKHALKCYK